MKVSINSIRKMNQFFGSSEDIAAIGIDELVAKVGSQLGGVDEVIPIGEKYQGAVVVMVVSCEKHPDADRLNVCTIDDGGSTPDVNRGDNGLVQVVCGAPNVAKGQTVVWLPPGSTVPETAGKDPFVLSSREIRGVVSNGMLASPKELALYDSHEGILVIDEDIPAGTSFVDAFGLKDDVVLDIENKMFTHRPDAFGFIGVARELAGIQQMPYRSPDWYRMDPAFPEGDNSLPFTVRNELPELVPRFSAIALRGVVVKPSPAWLQVELAKVGLRSINNIVDFTNYFMLLTGQPLHAYDYDKVKAQDPGADQATIVVRNPHEGEKLELLNGKTITPRQDAILIATDTKAIGLGGVMGGAETEVSDETTNIILEAATFDMYSIRRTSMAHGLFSDAVTRFNKGQSPLQTLAVLARIIEGIMDNTGATVASSLIDDNHVPEETLRRGSLHPPVSLPVSFINERLGSTLLVEEAAALLRNVEFTVEVNGEDMTVKAPFWRTDVEIREDVVEEVGRLYGYDRLPLALPRRDLTPTEKNVIFDLRADIREALTKAGASEVLTYSFVHGNLLDRVGQDKSQAYKLSNALSPDLQYYRLSLTPSLLDKVFANQKLGYERFVLFEMGKGRQTSVPDEAEPVLPRETLLLSLVYAASKRAHPGTLPAYYQAKQYLLYLLADQMHIGAQRIKLKALSEAAASPITAPFEPNRSAAVFIDDTWIGVVGEYRTAVTRALKLPAFTAGFEIDYEVLLKFRQDVTYLPLSKFPSVYQDITLKVAADTPYGTLYGTVYDELQKQQLPESVFSLAPLDLFQREDDPKHKNVTFRFTVSSYARTLRDKEVNALLDTVADVARQRFGAERV